jgi:hypothetical protein
MEESGEDAKLSTHHLKSISGKKFSHSHLDGLKSPDGLDSPHQTTGISDSTHTYESCEPEIFAGLINETLKHDETVAHLLPLDPTSRDVFDKQADGLILLSLLECAVPGCLEGQKVSYGSDLSVFKRNENLNLLLRLAAEEGLHLINIGSNDLSAGKETAVLSLLWQLYRLQLVTNITVKHCPELVVLLRNDETLEQFLMYSAETILLRWMRYHFESDGDNVFPCLNFGSTMRDPYVFSKVLRHIEPTLPSLYLVEGISRLDAAKLSIAIAQTLGARALISAAGLTSSSPSAKISFAARIFNTRHGLPPVDDEVLSQVNGLDESCFMIDPSNESKMHSKDIRKRKEMAEKKSLLNYINLCLETYKQGSKAVKIAQEDVLATTAAVAHVLQKVAAMESLFANISDTSALAEIHKMHEMGVEARELERTATDHCFQCSTAEQAICRNYEESAVCIDPADAKVRLDICRKELVWLENEADLCSADRSAAENLVASVVIAMAKTKCNEAYGVCLAEVLVTSYCVNEVRLTEERFLNSLPVRTAVENCLAAAEKCKHCLDVVAVMAKSFTAEVTIDGAEKAMQVATANAGASVELARQAREEADQVSHLVSELVNGEGSAGVPVLTTDGVSDFHRNEKAMSSSRSHLGQDASSRVQESSFEQDEGLVLLKHERQRLGSDAFRMKAQILFTLTEIEAEIQSTREMYSKIKFMASEVQELMGEECVLTSDLLCLSVRAEQNLTSSQLHLQAGLESCETVRSLCETFNIKGGMFEAAHALSECKTHLEKVCLRATDCRADRLATEELLCRSTAIRTESHCRIISQFSSAAVHRAQGYIDRINVLDIAVPNVEAIISAGISAWAECQQFNDVVTTFAARAENVASDADATFVIAGASRAKHACEDAECKIKDLMESGVIAIAKQKALSRVKDLICKCDEAVARSETHIRRAAAHEGAPGDVRSANDKCIASFNRCQEAACLAHGVMASLGERRLLSELDSCVALAESYRVTAEESELSVCRFADDVAELMKAVQEMEAVECTRIRDNIVSLGDDFFAVHIHSCMIDVQAVKEFVLDVEREASTATEYFGAGMDATLADDLAEHTSSAGLLVDSALASYELAASRAEIAQCAVSAILERLGSSVEMHTALEKLEKDYEYVLREVNTCHRIRLEAEKLVLRTIFARSEGRMRRVQKHFVLVTNKIKEFLYYIETIVISDESAKLEYEGCLDAYHRCHQLEGVVSSAAQRVSTAESVTVAELCIAEAEGASKLADKLMQRAKGYGYAAHSASVKYQAAQASQSAVTHCCEAAERARSYRKQASQLDQSITAVNEATRECKAAADLCYQVAYECQTLPGLIEGLVSLSVYEDVLAKAVQAKAKSDELVEIAAARAADACSAAEAEKAYIGQRATCLRDEILNFEDSLRESQVVRVIEEDCAAANRAADRAKEEAASDDTDCDAIIQVNQLAKDAQHAAAECLTQQQICLDAVKSIEYQVSQIDNCPTMADLEVTLSAVSAAFDITIQGAARCHNERLVAEDVARKAVIGRCEARCRVALRHLAATAASSAFQDSAIRSHEIDFFLADLKACMDIFAVVCESSKHLPTEV